MRYLILIMTIYFTFLIISFYFIILGNFDLLLSWWLCIGLLLLPLILSFQMRYFSLKTLCVISFITQTVTLPFFYLHKNYFSGAHIKPFNFKPVDCFYIFSKVLLFLFGIIFFFIIFYNFFSSLKGRLRNFNFKKSFNQPVKLFGKSNNIYLFLILIVIIILMIPLHLWMFSLHIGLVGIEPPKMPLKLSGLLYYFTHFFIPIFLGYLYLKATNNYIISYLTTSIILIYALFAGLITFSRLTMFLIVFPILWKLYIEHRYKILSIMAIIVCINYEIISGFREFCYFYKSFDFSYFISYFVKSFLDFNINNVINIINKILIRIEGFENLVNAEYYNLYNVGSPFEFILRMIWYKLSPINGDLHHIEWQGYIPQEGFFNGGSLLSIAVILGQAGIIWILISSIITALILVVIEKCLQIIGRISHLSYYHVRAIIFILTLLYFIDAGSTIFVLFFLLTFIISSLLSFLTFLNFRSNWKSFFKIIS